MRDFVFKSLNKWLGTGFVISSPVVQSVDYNHLALSNEQKNCLDRSQAAFLALACGDSIGATLEFKKRDSLPHVNDMQGGGIFHLQPGCWTDDTAMNLCFAHHLIEYGKVNPLELMKEFDSWASYGKWSATGVGFGQGATVRKALKKYRMDKNPLAGCTSNLSAGNGALMRVLPAIIAFHTDLNKALENVRSGSELTHRAPESLQACQLLTEILFKALNGAGREALDGIEHELFLPTIKSIARGEYKLKDRDGIQSTGYVVHTLEAALWCIYQTSRLEDAILLAVNLAEDSDTVAAVTGAIAGAIYGKEAIPEEWLEKLAWQDLIKKQATNLFLNSFKSRVD